MPILYRLHPMAWRPKASITLGNGFDLAIMENPRGRYEPELVVYQPKEGESYPLGCATLQRIEEIQGYLEQLKKHATDVDAPVQAQTVAQPA